MRKPLKTTMYRPVIDAIARRIPLWKKRKYNLTELSPHLKKIPLTKQEYLKLKQNGVNEKHFISKPSKHGQVHWFKVSKPNLITIYRFLKGYKHPNPEIHKDLQRLRFYKGSQQRINYQIGQNHLILGKKQTKVLANAQKLVNQRKKPFETREDLVNAIFKNVTGTTKGQVAANFNTVESKSNKKGINLNLYKSKKEFFDYASLTKIFKERIKDYLKEGYKLSKLPTQFKDISLTNAEAKQLKKANFHITGKFGAYYLHIDNHINKKLNKLSSTKINYSTKPYINVDIQGKKVGLGIELSKFTKQVEQILQKRGKPYEKRSDLTKDVSKKLGMSHKTVQDDVTYLERKLKKANVSPNYLYSEKEKQYQHHDVLIDAVKKRVKFLIEERGYSAGSLPSNAQKVPLTNSQYQLLKKGGFNVEESVPSKSGKQAYWVNMTSDHIKSMIKPSLKKDKDVFFQEVGKNLKFIGSPLFNIAGHKVPSGKNQSRTLAIALKVIKKYPEKILNKRVDIARAIAPELGWSERKTLITLNNISAKFKKNNLDLKEILFQTRASETKTILHGLSPKPTALTKGKSSRTPLLETKQMLKGLKNLRQNQIDEFYEKILQPLHQARTNLPKVKAELERAEEVLAEKMGIRKFTTMKEALKGSAEGKQVRTLRAKKDLLESDLEHFEKRGKELLKIQEYERVMDFYNKRRAEAEKHPKKVGHIL